ncbi:MAG: hypothetical protein WC423_27410, partial [Vulcanimicrobiota bacterium]
ITALATGSPDDAENSGSWNYNQKKLVFAQETHDFPLDSDEPIEITNSFGWDNGSPAINPSWSLSLGGIHGFVKEGTGTEVQATWDPKDLVLTQSLEEISLSLIGRAEGYPGTEYITGADGSVPSSKTGLQIINETITPDPPFEEPGSSVTLTATAVLIDTDLHPANIIWRVELLDSNSAPVDEDFASGTGPDIIAEWDGTADGQLIEDPETYQFHIYANVCPEDTGGGASRAIRAQEDTIYLEDDERVAIGFLFQISAIEFGGNEDAKRNENGPYFVYDYINDIAPNSEAQWKKEGDEMVPVVMKMGENVYAKATFQAISVDEPAENFDIKVRMRFNGQESILEPEVVFFSIAGRVVLGTAVVKLTLPGEIGRHKVEFEWEATARLSSGTTAKIEVKTPKEGGHMIYGVFGDQPETTKNGVEDESYIWYHPEHFRDEIPVSQPSETPTRSPLDLATHWASGESSRSGTLATLGDKFFEHSGYVYWGNTENSFYRTNTEIEFKYEKTLRNNKLECADGANLLKIFANYLGLDARIRRLEDDVSLAGESRFERDFLFTNYIKMIGTDPSNPFISEVEYFLPLTLTKSRKAQAQGFGSAKMIVDGHTYPLDWVQYRFNMHQVAELDGNVVDCVARFDSSGPRRMNINPQFIINGLNVSFPYGLARAVEARLENTNLTEETLNALRASYSEFFGPTASARESLGLSEYLRHFLYGYDSSQADLRELTGFNAENFEATSTLVDKITFVNEVNQ